MKTIEFQHGAGDTLTMKFGEETPTIPMQQVTIAHWTSENRGFLRQIQISNEYLMVKRPYCPTVAIHVDDLISLAIRAEPMLSFPPIVAASAKENVASLAVKSELPVASYQWQESSDGGATWFDVLGANSATYTRANESALRCVVTNAAGATTSNPV